MTIATLKEITEKIGIKLEDEVSYHEEGNKGIIEVDFSKVRNKKLGKMEAVDVFADILSMSKDIGVSDMAKNHDHYLYGSPKRDEA